MGENQLRKEKRRPVNLNSYFQHSQTLRFVDLGIRIYRKENMFCEQNLWTYLNVFIKVHAPKHETDRRHLC